MVLLRKKGYLLVFALVIIPVIYLAFSSSFDFSNFSTSMRSIGRILGISGIILFSFTLLMNTRLKFTEKLFSGLDKTYKAHHNLGTIAFLFLIFHPLFLVSQYLSFSFAAALNFLYPEPLNVAFGTLALLAMILSLAITFFSRLKYQNWKFTHRFLGIAFLLASIHTLLISSDVSRNLPLRIYILGFAVIGIGSYLYRTIFWKTLVKRKDYQIKSIKRLDNIIEITLSPKNEAIKFSPGQFVFVSFDSSVPSSEPHPFTISSSSSKNELVLSVKELGDFTKDMNELKSGTNVKVEGPFGKFSLINHKSRNYIFIAGGIGITPFLSMLRSISDEPGNYPLENIDLYYSTKAEKESVFLKELREISKKLPENKKLNVFYRSSEKNGNLNIEHIRKNSENIKNSQIFICGPPKMMKSLKEQLISEGISKNNIQIEEFGL